MLKEDPFFSVIINCHNSEKFLVSAIESVLNQSYKNYELIIFDNASSDQTLEIAHSYGEVLKCFHVDSKLSLGAARNAAVRLSKGNYITFLDSDDLWLPNKLEVQALQLTSSESQIDVGLCGSDALRVDKNLKPIARFSMGRFHWPDDLLRSFLHDCFIPMSSAVINRSAWFSEGGCNEEYEIIEEYDLWIRIARNYKVLYSTECLVNIRFHDDNSSRNYEAYHSEINKMLDSLENWDEINKSYLEHAKIVWQFRQSIVELIYFKPKKNTNHLGHYFLKLAFLVLKHPLIASQYIKNYFSLRLFKFLKLKYSRI